MSLLDNKFFKSNPLGKIIRKWFKSHTNFQIFLYFSFTATLVVGIATTSFLIYLSSELPDLEQLANPNYNLPTQIFDRNGELVDEYYIERRVLARIDEIPLVLIKALIATEDRQFLDHFGISPLRIFKAALVNIVKMGYSQGASTLTQQTAKMFLLSSEKKLIRKIKEILLALKIENRFSKKKILELYLNKAYFGHGAYGIEAAAQGYFSKSVSELNLSEAALLAGLVQRPSYWAPTYSMENALRRRNIVLKAMADVNYISEKAREITSQQPIVLNLQKEEDSTEVDYYLEHVRKYIYKKYGSNQLYKGGLKVYLAMDLKYQVKAQEALREGLEELERRRGYKGAIKNIVDEESGITPEKIATETKNNRLQIGRRVRGVVTKVYRKRAIVDVGGVQGNLFLEQMKWARKYDLKSTLTYWNQVRNVRSVLKPGDVIETRILDFDQSGNRFALELTQKPAANGAIYSMDPRTGEVLAMSGGYSFNDSEFNRAIQGKRQSGSAFKPIVYTAALDNTYTAASILEDTPLVYENVRTYMPSWKPTNYSKKFLGKVTLRDSLTYSKNIPTVKLAMSIGIKKVIDYARKLGVTTPIPRDLTITIGSSSVTLEEMVAAFGVFANSGQLTVPIYVKRIEDSEGNIIEENNTIASRVISEETAFIMTSILEDVVQRGTAQKLKALGRPTAGKTGTTNDFIDAWYIGFVPQLITGVYVGHDNPNESLGKSETGGKAASPIWLDFMKFATEPLPSIPFKQPSEIEMVPVHPKSGLRACSRGIRRRFEFFKPGTAPRDCHQKTQSNRSPDQQRYSPNRQEYGDDSIL